MNACIEILIELFKRPHQVLSYFHDFEKWNVIYVGSLLKVLQDLTWPHYLPVGSNDPLHEQSNFTLIFSWQENGSDLVPLSTAWFWQNNEKKASKVSKSS